MARKLDRRPEAVDELARWLTEAAPIAPDADLDGMIPRWAAAVPDPGWRGRIAADASAARLLEKAVERLAAREQEFYPHDLGQRLAPLGVDLAPAFGRAALAMVGYGYDQAVSRIIAGALLKPETLEPAVRAAQALFRAEAPDDRHGWRLQLANGVYDAEHAEHLSAGDEGHWCAAEIVEAWVWAKRAEDGWATLAAFPDADLLVWYWKQAIEKDDAPLDPQEFDALVQAARGCPAEGAAWELAVETADPCLVAPVATRLQDIGLDTSVRRWLHRAQAVHDRPALMAEQARLVADQDLEGVLKLQTICCLRCSGPRTRPSPKRGQSWWRPSLRICGTWPRAPWRTLKRCNRTPPDLPAPQRSG